MLGAILLFAPAQAPFEVEGLRAGESAVVVEAAARADARRDSIRPRILDAATGRPLEGVLIETWTESGTDPLRIEMRIDVSTTGRDGCARVRIDGGAARAEKVRLSKPGYASRVIGVSAAFEDEVRLYPSRPLHGHVLDFDGRPVAGALVRTRETCAHAVPAAQTHTDAFGRFRMEDFPALSDGAPDVEVLERSHEPLYQLYGRDLLQRASFYNALDLYVARSRSVEVQLVDHDGKPLPHRLVRRPMAPVTEAWTDAEGRCTLPPRPLDSDGVYEIADPLGRESLWPVLFVEGQASRTSPVVAGSEPEGRITVLLQGEDAWESPPILIVPAAGRFVDTADGEETALPLGSARVIVGGGFTGFARTTRDVEIASEPLEITMPVQRTPRLRIHVGSLEFARLVVQAGDESTAGSSRSIDDHGVWEQGVPTGVPITILCELHDGGIRRASIPPLGSGQETDVDVDFEMYSTVVRHGMDEAKPRSSTLWFALLDPEGHPLAQAEGRLYAAPTSFDFAAGRSGEFTWTVPAHTAYRAAFRAPGFTTVYWEGTVPLRAAEDATEVTLTRRAVLEVSGGVKLVDGFRGGVEPSHDGFVMDAAAGPLMLTVERQDGLVLALDLVLAGGETRSIHLR